MNNTLVEILQEKRQGSEHLSIDLVIARRLGIEAALLIAYLETRTSLNAEGDGSVLLHISEIARGTAMKELQVRDARIHLEKLRIVSTRQSSRGRKEWVLYPLRNFFPHLRCK